MGIFSLLGAAVLGVIDTLGGLALMLANAVKWAFRPPFRLRLIIEQMASIGVGSLPVVIMTGIFTGMVLAYQVYSGFAEFGMEYMTGALVALALARELGPVLSAIMVTARSGSAMTAELGTMRVTEQIDALYALAVEPVQYLVVPRVIAGMLVMPLLNLVCVVFGMLGGYMVGVKVLGVNASLYMDYTIRMLGMDDMLNGTIKALTFGLILALVGCYKGFFTSGGALGVGRATTASVVVSCVLILLFDYILTAVMF
jgi:phospholipid/cholesterol/gamma-HCH transport system permease protein